MDAELLYKKLLEHLQMKVLGPIRQNQSRLRDLLSAALGLPSAWRAI
jgi:hypothetical protein